MSGSLNKVMLIGNLGKDPEIRTIPNGTKVANFSVATNESYSDKSGNKVDKTEWHRIVMWRGLAEIAEKYLRKGSTAYFEGKLSTRSWDDGNGQKKYSTEIVVDNMQMLGGRSSESSPAYASAPDQSYGAPDQGAPSGGGASMPPAQDEDLPF